MREIYHEQLRILGEELMQMGALCEEGISAAMKALFNNNEEMAQRAMEIEREIDRKERDIEAQSMKLLLCQQPVAGELRTVSSALRLISDMERIGDQASDIAEITVHVTQRDPEVMELLHRMAGHTVRMVTESVDSFVRRDLNLAREVQAYDDVVDQDFVKVKECLIQNVHSSNEAFADLLMIAKYLERIGDHATNVAEWVEYSLTGTHPKGD
ncbi:MAG: phosphate signaling complex protein PhoU [Candidatus Heritagella sp.]|nr:phosphate signaling complex protein PhoU [Candidatus Heritagella sp.]